jgi:hypothetical protein
VSDDDDADCVEHVWHLVGATFGDRGSDSEYKCVRCGAVLAVGPGETHPQTV